MIFYHGSFLEVEKPDLIHSRPNVDFGRGFYVTPLYEQAVKWCGKFKHRGKNGIISRYEYDESQESKLKILKFDSYSEEWLDFILNCRSGKDLTANSILLQKKYSRVIERFAKRQGLSLDAALKFFYHSEVYQLIRDGVSDMHCMSDEYLAEEMEQEYAEKVCRILK